MTIGKTGYHGRCDGNLRMALTDERAALDGSEADSGILSVLETATATIDSMWRSALEQGMGQTALHLGEASQGIHRALIALASLRLIPAD